MTQLRFGVWLTLILVSPAVSVDQPNMVYILADDFDYGDARL